MTDGAHIKEIRDLVQQGLHVREVDGRSFTVLPVDAQLKDLESLQIVPQRARGNVTVTTLESFKSYVMRFRDEAGSTIFADQDTFTLRAVLNYHRDAERPQHGDHICTYKLPLSEEWKRWRHHDGRQCTQAEFAQFLEENNVDIREPAPATMLEVARKLEAKTKVDFSRGERLSDGNIELTYQEKTEATVGKQKLQVPEEFKIGVPVFFGGPIYGVTAKLRYRIKESALQIWYDLHRAEYAEQDAFKEAVDDVTALVGEAFVFYGKVG